jgi:GDP-mannose transporter
MSGKKYDDDVEMNDIDQDTSEREAFLQKPAAPAAEENTGGLISQLENHSAAAVLAYCFSSISMTVVNKYVVSGSSWNLNFLYLAIQVCNSLSHKTIKFLMLLQKTKMYNC